MPTFLALLRGINVSGHRKVPMAELRAVCSELGFTDVQTYIQSGNLVFGARGKASTIEAELERAGADRFGFDVDIVVRTPRQWSDYLSGNPFPRASQEEPNRVLLALSKRRPKRDTAASLRERATAGEQVEGVGDALWFHCPAGIARSKLTPALIDRLAGSPVTARNWRTVQKLAEMAGVVR